MTRIERDMYRILAMDEVGYTGHELFFCPYLKRDLFAFVADGRASVASRLGHGAAFTVEESGRHAEADTLIEELAEVFRGTGTEVCRDTLEMGRMIMHSRLVHGDGHLVGQLGVLPYEFA